MRTYRAKTGPFLERPFYTTEDIESICIDELYKTDLMPPEPGPVRIDRFIEKRFEISINYNEDLPESVLGVIEFGPNGVKGLKISRALADEGTKVSERRLSVTLAHEGGHGLLHTHLFVLGEKPTSLFGDEESNEPKILCRNNTVLGGQDSRETAYSGKWWEYQANLAIGPLLLPRKLVHEALTPFLVTKGIMGMKKLNSSRRAEAERKLSHVFDVNPIVARIRLEGLFPVSEEKQLTL